MRFRITQHSRLPGQEIVEVRNDRNQLVAVVYPHAQGLHVVSKHMAGYAATIGVPQGVLFVLTEDVRDA